MLKRQNKRCANFSPCDLKDVVFFARFPPISKASTLVLKYKALIVKSGCFSPLRQEQGPGLSSHFLNDVRRIAMT